MGRFHSGSVGRAACGGASLLMLAACGGGGGVNSASGGAGGGGVTAVPAIDYDDAEYGRSNGARNAGAIAAWNAGATGAGQTIAIVDTGIAAANGEFAGRIASASRDVAGTRTIADDDGHGTEVAAVAAAARDGSGMEGLAFAATILALRADTPGSCADKCGFSDANIASAVDLARTSGAKVINLSLGGSSTSRALTQAIDRATAAGIVIVIAAGNDGTGNPDAFAQIASGSAARGLVVIAGSHDADGSLSSFSDKAGTFSAHYLAALGNAVRSIDKDGNAVLVSGTSFAAPAIAASVALLEQAFPNLTPAQIVALLYSSATDAGAAGVDAVFGNGLLDLTKAFQPKGATTLAGSTIVLGGSDATTLSAAMGDADLRGLAAARAVVLDTLGRAYTMALTATVARRAESRPLLQAIGSDLRASSQAFGALSLSATVARGFAAGAGRPWNGLALGRNGFDQAIDVRPVDGSATLDLGAGTRAAFAFAAQGRTLADGLSGTAGPGNFLAARASGDTPGFAPRTGMSFALLQTVGRTAITIAAERGTVPAVSAADSRTPAYAMMSVRAERRLGPLRLALGVGSLRETATLLGSRLAPAFGGGGATTRSLDLGGRLGLAHGWSLGGAWRRGWTRPDGGGVLGASLLTSRSASADLSWTGRDGRFALRVATPPRVDGGGLMVTVPSRYDYATGTIAYSTARIGLTPRGSERDVEASYGLHLAGGWMDGNVYWRRQPGNVAALPDDVGTAIRYSLTF